MMKRQKRVWFTFLSGTLLHLIAAGFAYAQGLPVDFSGRWNTVTGNGKKIVITLESVRRTNVTGTYARNGLTSGYRSSNSPVEIFVKVSAAATEPILQNLSSIRGTVNGNVLRFTWQEDGGHGAGRFTLSPDGQSFEGTFTTASDNPDDASGGTWNGTRAPNFAGAWRANLGAGVMELIMQQAGAQVTGQLRVNSADLGVIRDGVVEGNTLKFTIVRSARPSPNGPNLPDQYVGVGELVMAKGNKSFSGTVLGTSTTGTRLGR